MAKHSFPYKPICFKCKATFAHTGEEKERTRDGGRVRGGEKERGGRSVEAANWYERKLV